MEDHDPDAVEESRLSPAGSIRILIVEDETVVARRLMRLLRSILGEQIERLNHVTSLGEATEILENAEIDLLFLDLNLHGRDGYSLLESTASRSFQTVIVSAHSDQAIRAFELGVTDFVAKPYDEARLRLAIERVSERDAELRDRLKYLAVRRAGSVELIPVEEVVYIRGAGDYSELNLASGETRLHDKSLTSLENILPTRFVRVHRSWIVDLRSVSILETREGSRYAIRLQGGEEIPVSRTRVGSLRAMLR